MSWALLTLSAVVLWAIVNQVDKFVITRWVRQPLAILFVSGVVGALFGVVVYFVRGFSALSYSNILVALVAGVLYMLMGLFYLKAAKTEEISRIVPLSCLTPLFVLILAGVFLGEVFTFDKYVGILLLVAGAVLVSSRSLTKISLGRPFWLMILSSLALSVNYVLTKYLLDFADFWTVYSYTRMGALVAVLPFAYSSVKGLAAATRKNGKKVVALISVSESINYVAVIFITIATAIGFVSLVSALSSLQPFFVLFFAVLIIKFFPQVFKEEISKATIGQKIIAIILMFVGALLVT